MNSDTLVYTAENGILWVRIGKSVLSLNEDLYICLCYVTPDESSRQSLTETNIFTGCWNLLFTLKIRHKIGVNY